MRIALVADRCRKRPDPDPDLELSRPRGDGRRPAPQDVFLVIDVSDSSLQSDLSKKRALYARAGIPEYWVVNLVADRVERFWSPRDGVYRQDAVATSDELSPVAAPDVRIVLDSVFARFKADE